MRMFIMKRDEDVSGVSGTGIVAEGVEFADGTVALRWLPSGTVPSPHVAPTTVLHPNIDNVAAVHGHDGRTRLRLYWLESDGDTRHVPVHDYLHDIGQEPLS